LQTDFLFEDKGFFDLNPLTMGYEDCKSGHKYGPAMRHYYLIHYVIKGKGKFYSKAQTMPVQKGEIFIIKPREICTYIADEQLPWSYIWIGFNGELSKKIDTLPKPVMRYEKDTFIQMKLVEQYKNMREEYLAGKLFELYTELFRADDKASDYIKQTIDYINSNYMRVGISVERLAKLIGLDRRYLSRVFKKSIGMTMQQCLVNKRMEHAAVLLNSGHSVGEVATLIGYDDAFHFSKMFKKHYGISPNRYKAGSAI